MILRPAQIYLLRLGRPVVPANFGGDSDSDSSTNTTNQTTNWATSIDKRSVASDAAVSLTGNGNAVDRSTSTANSGNTTTTSITEMFDKSNRSTNFADSSNRSTNFADSSVRDSSTFFSDSSVKTDSHATSMFDASTKLDSHNTSMVDNSDRSVSYSSSTTDYGSVGKALDGLGMMSSKSLDVAAGGVAGTLDAMKYLADQQNKSMAAAFDLTKSASANALTNSAAVLGFANSTVEKTAAAFADAKDGGTSKAIKYALAAAAAIGVAFALKS